MDAESVEMGHSPPIVSAIVLVDVSIYSSAVATLGIPKDSPLQARTRIVEEPMQLLPSTKV